MASRRELEAALNRVLDALNEYSDDLILIGGWVPYIQLSYGRGAVPSVRTSLTMEADVLVPRHLAPSDRRPIAEVLTAAGFTSQAGGVVWVRDHEVSGERIEFMQPLRGPAPGRGTARVVPDQPELRALALDHLQVMEDFNETILVSRTDATEGRPVRVPTLGAFAVNKANTFHLRGGTDAHLRAGKDLLYLRDIAAAGSPATDVLQGDLTAIQSCDAAAQTALRRARYHLRAVAPGYLGAVAEMLAEREGFDLADAKADVEGHLTDVCEFFPTVEGG